MIFFPPAFFYYFVLSVYEHVYALSRASLVAQRLKRLPAMQETRV